MNIASAGGKEDGHVPGLDALGATCQAMRPGSQAARQPGSQAARQPPERDEWGQH